MDFAKAEYLTLLWSMPAAAAFLLWAGRQRRAALKRLGQPRLIATLAGSISAARRRWKTGLWFTALLALIVATARPRWGTQVWVSAREGVEVVVALDVSSSMLAEDIKPNRLARAKLTIEELMTRLGGNDVGLVSFSGAAFVQFPLTNDFSTARSFLDAAQPETISRPGTALEEALRVAMGAFPEKVATNRVILLLTDGEGHEGDPIRAAQEAANEGVTIHAIGFGSPTGEPIPIRDANGTLTGYKKDQQGQMVLSRLDEITLQRIAGEAGGLYFRASAGGQEIDALVNAIAAMGTAEKEDQFEVQGVERFAPFAAVSLLALAAELVLSARKRET
jgi:Ca-activated chloride channel family protein